MMSATEKTELNDAYYFMIPFLCGGYKTANEIPLTRGLLMRLTASENIPSGIYVPGATYISAAMSIQNV
jgi:hypothetical protein